MTNSITKKDKVYKGEKIEVNGSFITFDGKYFAETDCVKFYKMHGDVTLFDEAIQNFCVTNNISKALKK